MSEESCQQCVSVEYELPSGRSERWLVESVPMIWAAEDIAEVKILRYGKSTANESVTVAVLPTESGRAALSEFTEHGKKGGPIAVLVDGRMVDLSAVAPDSELLLIELRNEDLLEVFLDSTDLRERITE